MALFQRFQQVANSDDTPNDTPRLLCLSMFEQLNGA